MSCDIYLECGHCDSALYEFNITSNVHGIVDVCILEGALAAGIQPPAAARTESGQSRHSWARLAGWTGADAAPLLAQASAFAADERNAARLRALEPASGWGSLDSVRECLERLAASCAKWPHAVIRTSN